MILMDLNKRELIKNKLHKDKLPKYYFSLYLLYRLNDSIYVIGYNDIDIIIRLESIFKASNRETAVTSSYPFEVMDWSTK
jgi:hypothetical protein